MPRKSSDVPSSSSLDRGPGFAAEREILQRYLSAEGKGNAGNEKVRPLRPDALFWPEGLRSFGVNLHLNYDPAPPPMELLVTPDGAVFGSSDVLEALAHMKVEPRSEEEAAGLATMIAVRTEPDLVAIAGPDALVGTGPEDPSHTMYVMHVPDYIRSTLQGPVARKAGAYYEAVVYTHRYRHHPRTSEPGVNVVARHAVRVRPGGCQEVDTKEVWNASSA